MRRYSKFLSYQLLIVYFYVIVCIYFFTFLPAPSFYAFKAADLFLIFPLVVAAVISFFLINLGIHFGTFKIRREGFFKVILTILYLLVVIAIPEEILFRGIIQGLIIEPRVVDLMGVVVVSASIFGLAHLPNRAVSLQPRDWNWKLAVVAGVGGIFLALAFILTGSLVVPTLLHVLFSAGLYLCITESSKPMSYLEAI